MTNAKKKKGKIQGVLKASNWERWLHQSGISKEGD